MQGLFLEGASWDVKAGLMIDQKPGEMYCPMPLIWFETQKSKCRDEKNEEKEGEGEEEIFYYNCPLFKTVKRSAVISSGGSSNDKVIEIVRKMIFNLI